MRCWMCLTIFGALALVFGIFTATVNNIALDLILRGFMVLSKTGMSYPMWIDLPVPLMANFYLFNVSNAEDVYKHGAQPKLTQMGPYTFQEFHHKFDDVWNDDNATVTYKQKKHWIHRGGADLDQEVTVINTPFASLGGIVGKLPEIERRFVNLGLGLLKDEKLFVTKTAREILFDGYEDPLLNAADALAKFGIHMDGITSKFGFFFGRNDTWYADGITNIHTGYNNLGQLGQVAAFNYSDRSPFFEGKCGEYKGSPDLFPPYMNDKPKQYAFNTDLCRTLELTLEQTDGIEVHGTSGYKYVLDKSFFANASVNPDNACFGTSQLPSGVFNASACRFGAPVFMSNPHFYQADPYYASLLHPGSLHPDESQHQSSFIFEPISGIPLKVEARFQVNVLLNRIKELTAFKNLPSTVFLPIMWTDIQVEMTEELAKQTWYLSNLTIIMISMGGAMIGFGVGLLIYGFFLYMTSSPTTVRPVYDKIEEQAAGAGGSGEEGDTIIEDMSEGVNDAEVDRTF